MDPNEPGRGFWQPILVENQLPSYCRFCWHIGHAVHPCTIKYPEFQHTSTHKSETYIRNEFRPKKNVQESNVHTAQYEKIDSIPDKDGIVLDMEAALGLELEKQDTGKEVMISSPIQEGRVTAMRADGSRMSNGKMACSELKDDPAMLIQAGQTLETSPHQIEGMAETLKSKLQPSAEDKSAMMELGKHQLFYSDLAEGKGSGLMVSQSDHAHEVRKIEEIKVAADKSDQAHTGLATCDQNNFEKSGSKALATRMEEKQIKEPALQL